MDFGHLTERAVRIEYANMAKLNKIRTFAKKHCCRVEVSRYARDAYEGKVIVPMIKSREIQTDIVETIAEYIGFLGC